ncbi:MAG: plasmid recombination protein [Lachnospiraceae bacterium]|nr:plasmid recombination protein [Lachnospiraceae bacterium]MCM1229284.1 plasmid recombination protein [Ruminococcus flavefaciens]
MKSKRISFGQGKGSITHNNRTFIANNVDRNRIADNVTFISKPIGDVYEELFGGAVERYNARQKRNDRKIHSTYYEHLFHCKPSNSVITATDKRKSFYEDVVQIGKMEDSGFGTEDFQLVADCLTEYMSGFQERNPNFHVFNAVLHMDEATPHLHIDYVPIGHYKRGMDTQNGIVQALKEMGYGEGKQAIARWRAAEVEVLNKICQEHGIEPLPPEKSRGTLEVSEYKEQRRKAEQLEIENEKLRSELDALNVELKSATEKKVKIVEIDSIETKKSRFSKKVSISEEDFENLTDLAKKQVASVKNTKKLKSENTELSQKVVDLEVQVKFLTAELDKYRQPATFSREKLKNESQKISELEQLRSKYRKALEFINSRALATEFEVFQHTTARGSQLE